MVVARDGFISVYLPHLLPHWQPINYPENILAQMRILHILNLLNLIMKIRRHLLLYLHVLL